MSDFVAHKFGGSSLASAERIRHVVDVLCALQQPEQVVVVSAMQGTTDALIGLVHSAADEGQHGPALAALVERHRTAIRGLLGDEGDALLTKLEAEWLELAALLDAQALLGVASDDILALVQGLGEVWSAQIVAASFKACGHSAAFLDAREILVVQHGELGVAVDWPATEAKLADWRAAHPASRYVVTGFVARERSGRITTLGRNGSDYSGSIFARLFAARELHIWTDVDGVLSADPRRVPDAVLLPHLSYDEAFELAYFGAKVVHPQTMQPVLAAKIPVFVRNTFKPEHPGSRIDTVRSLEVPVKGISTVDQLALVEIHGSGMIGVPGTAERVFGALHRAKVSVVMISQGSSEHSICCVVREGDADEAVSVLRDAFARELDQGQVQAIEADKSISVLAIVGDGMAGTPGIAARLFTQLARANINVRAIAQGASERNISVAISSSEATRALRAVHAGFYLSPQTISIGFIGPGTVGRALLAQLAAAQPRLKAQASLDLRVRALAGSRRMLLEPRAIDLSTWPERMAEAGEDLDLDAFTRHVHAEHLPHALIVDCSASAAIAARYPEWLAAGIHVITPNKQAGSAPIELFDLIRKASEHGGRWRYEATVGAGLPVIQTLRDLLDTGDEVLAVEGILSGTLSYLFNRYDGSLPFSVLLAEARAAGYTEPDPRDDLSGMDVARKLVILARECGMRVELADVALEGLVPSALASLDVDTFMARSAELDGPLGERLAAARNAGRLLRFVARLDASGKASVGLVELAPDHAFAHLKPTDNVVQFTTRRYRDNPLVVQGPGAGPEVTAAGVFADLLRVAAGLGARV